MSCHNNDFFRSNFRVTITDGHIYLECKKAREGNSDPTLALFKVYFANLDYTINPYF